ncbi:LysR family transcriptional regulator [Chitinasiproducens palmae]|uniref:DNA-binding transcriptional regulator, LysR family n=1 Tax=Chitinasiproducens palmae TaxID=1770053 RepID=A0A1H2PIW6_9BURK|nr:LysR substrate-binding domain-containing protein [Chitinasiproducens palmae]SDV46202.1 DNA-binding transcriptional regulator, LysR family [Chitinasiproducens palmae]
MKHQHLQFFLAMAEHGSIRGAARALGLTQPAVTKTVRLLERELGLPLVQRTINGVVLTEHGHALLRHAQRVDTEMRRTADAMAARREGDGGSVMAAVSASAALTLIPAALERFLVRLPRARVAMIESSLKTALDRLFDGSLDLAVLQLGPGEFPDHIQTIKLFDIEQRIVVRRDHPMRSARSLPELMACRWVVPQHPQWRGVFPTPSFWPTSMQPPATVVECSSLTIATALVRHADFVSVLPALSLTSLPSDADIVALAIEEPLPSLRMSIVYNADTPATDASDAFMKCLVAAAADWQPEA